MNSWEENLIGFKKINDEKLYDDFLRFPVINKTMFVGNCEMVDNEYNFIKSNERFEKYKDLLKGSVFGNPVRYDKDSSTCGNHIHHLYHLFNFMDETNIEISDIKSVLEFGGGYGNMAYILRNTEKYTIFDFQEVLKLQKVFLDNSAPDLKVTYEHNCEQVKGEYDLFISTWALSEAPIEVRNDFLKHIDKCKHILIAYSAIFDGISNNDYFEKTMITELKNEYTWHNMLIRFMDGNHKYLFGIKK